jgi:2-polyprenyl-6-methoxyphenol hydroxylase-like FAD-dependent oxidoreductase
MSLQPDASRRNTDVIVVGAGPTGLVLALWLTRLGVRVRIVDRAPEPGTTSRAVVVHARTLELYRQIGLADAVVACGRRMDAVNLWTSGRHVARVVFGDMGEGISPFPYALVYPQDEHERLLIDRLAGAGVEVERETELMTLEEAAGRVLVRFRRADGVSEECEAAYVAGCDGAHSTVRQSLAIGFPGGTYSHLFYVADVEAHGAAMDGGLHAALDTTDFLAVFPMKGDGRARLIGTLRRGIDVIEAVELAEDRHENLSWKDVSTRVIEWMRIDVQRVNWFSTYRVHHRVADRFRKGRAFLLGDAAHIHSPVGGQGMNTGIGDAVNLAWKLAAVLTGRADPSLVDSYEPERIAFARRLVATTDRAFTAVTSNGLVARCVRLQIVPALAPMVFRFAPIRRFMFRTVSQTLLNYRGSPLSEGRAGAVWGGDRLPWVKTARSTRSGLSEPPGVPQDNFAPLASLDWQVHVYGNAAPDIEAMCDARKLPLHVFPWDRQAERTGLQRDAVYLLRPDGYVALADSRSSATAVAAYLDARKLTHR